MIRISGSDKLLIENIINNSCETQNYNLMNNSRNGLNKRNNSVGGNIRRNNYGFGQSSYQYQMNPF